MLILWYVEARMALIKFLFKLAHYLNNVHTWAIFFLRHLANMSSMFPFWASTDSGFVPNLGPRPKPRHPEEVVYSPKDSCSNFTQRLFPQKLPQQHTCTASYNTVAAKKIARQRKITTDFWITTAKLIFAVDHSFFTDIPPEPSCLMFYFCTQ